MIVSFTLPAIWLFWFYVPLVITLLVGIFYLFIFSSSDTSGAGMVGFFMMFPLGILIILSWMMYFAAGMFFGVR